MLRWFVRIWETNFGLYERLRKKGRRKDLVQSSFLSRVSFTIFSFSLCTTRLQDGCTRFVKHILIEKCYRSDRISSFYCRCIVFGAAWLRRQLYLECLDRSFLLYGRVFIPTQGNRIVLINYCSPVHWLFSIFFAKAANFFQRIWLNYKQCLLQLSVFWQLA